MIALPMANGSTNKPPGRRHLSYSAVSLFRSCSLRWAFRYLHNLPEKSVSSSLVLGASLHAALGHHYEQLLVGRQPRLTELIDIFWSEWHARNQADIRFNKGEDLNTVGRQAGRLLQAFQHSHWATPNGTIIGVEEEIRGRLAADLPEFLARLDLVVETDDCVTIIDFKTARGAWSQDQVRDAGEQLLLYHQLAGPLAGGKPIRLQFAVLTKSKVPELALHEVPAGRRPIERLTVIVRRVWQAIQAGAIYPSPSPISCPTCPYREPCRAWTG